MRALFLLALLFPSAALADLYRWVDPDTGSVKFSNYPPAAPVAGVERIPYLNPFQPRAPQPQPAAKPAAADTLTVLRAKWRELRQALDSIPTQKDFERAGGGLAQHAEAYQAVRAELDRIDPGGAARRRAEDEPLLVRFMQGMKAHVEPAPPAKK